MRELDEAVECDIEAWRKFTVIEAKRIMTFLDLPKHGGLDALERALKFRLYAFLNVQECSRPDDVTLIFKMLNCRVQSARKRKGLPDHPCKPVGEVEYSLFASTIDPRIKTSCLLAHQTLIRKNSIVDGRLLWSKSKLIICSFGENEHSSR